MWLRHANTRQIPVGDPATAWMAEHDGYESAGAGIRHQRIVRLDKAARSMEITDELAGKASQTESSGVSGQDKSGADGGHEMRLAFHLGPDVTASLAGAVAELAWPGASVPGAARMELPTGLRWTLHRGETAPAYGWYSEGLGRKVPAITLIGTGQGRGGTPLVTRLKFYDKDPKAEA
jgi:hypothetical protein